MRLINVGWVIASTGARLRHKNDANSCHTHISMSVITFHICWGEFESWIKQNAVTCIKTYCVNMTLPPGELQLFIIHVECAAEQEQNKNNYFSLYLLWESNFPHNFISIRHWELTPLWRTYLDSSGSTEDGKKIFIMQIPYTNLIFAPFVRCLRACSPIV